MSLQETKILLFPAKSRPAAGEDNDSQKDEPFLPEVIFGRKAPVEVEIGCGKGKFLVERATEAPEIDFIGVDRVAKWMKAGDRRASKRQLSNLLFIRAE